MLKKTKFSQTKSLVFTRISGFETHKKQKVISLYTFINCYLPYIRTNHPISKNITKKMQDFKSKTF